MGLASAHVELEDRLTVPSAEGLDLDLVLAGLGSRSSALLVDLVLQSIALFVLGLFAGAFGDAGIVVVAIGGFAVLLGYPVLAEAFGGRTIGKRLLGLAVVSVDGSPATFLQAVIRNVVRFVDALPGTYTVGMISVLATRRSQRVGDLAAGTLVVRRAARPAAPSFERTWAPDPGTVATAPSGADATAVTADELAAIRSFLGRRHELAPAARQQLGVALAERLRPKVAGIPLDGGPEAFLEAVVAATART